MQKLFCRVRPWWAVFLAMFATTVDSCGADTLTWHTNENRVSADVRGVPLVRLLAGITQLSGWRVYLESNITFTASAKFTDLPPGEALRHLLGDLNFALVPQTNSSPRLYVFRSSQANATLLIQPGDLNGWSRADGAKPIPNELVVRLKAGAKPASIACLQGAKITGHIDALNTYRVKFDNEAATKTARDCLSGNPDVELVDSNFPMEPINPVQPLAQNIAPDFNLKIKPQTGDCPPIVGLVDTGMPKLGKGIDDFIKPSISVVDCPQAPTGLTHGSAMAETILRSVQSTTGGSSSVKILPVDVYGCNETTTTFDVAKGTLAAINNGANIINYSLGSGGDSGLLRDIINQASQQGIVFFAAAGNQPVTTPVYPAAYPDVVAVTAGDRNGQVASYANRGSFVDIMTPGTSVVPFNGQSYAVMGTSAATAYASGLAAGLADASKNCPTQVIPTIRSKLGVNFNSPP